MPVWVYIIAAFAFIGVACYARGLYLELQSTKEKLKLAKEAIEYLTFELNVAYTHSEKP